MSTTSGHIHHPTNDIETNTEEERYEPDSEG